MTAFRFNQRRTRRWWYGGGVTLVATLFFVVFFVASSGAVVDGSPSGFETDDGNMVLNATTANTNTDWNCFAGAGNTGGFSTSTTFPPAGCKVNSGATQVTADLGGEIGWVPGQKFDTACPQLSVNNNPPKDEFTNVAAYSDTAANLDEYFYGATIRPKVNGNVSGDVELNQSSGNGTTSAGCRTAGDRLIAYDFLNGGTFLDFHVLTWITPDNPLTTTIDESTLGGNSGTCLVAKAMPCWGANVIHPLNDKSTFEGEANQTPISAADNGINNTLLPVNAFAEFGINLSLALNLRGQCIAFPQQVWESRSSGSSFTSNPQDIEITNTQIQNCGTITIIKHTFPRGLDQAFSFNQDVSGTAAFSLNDKDNSTADSTCDATATPPVTVCNTKTFTNVLTGTYHVSEGTVPSGYAFHDVACTSSTGSSTANGTSDSSHNGAKTLTLAGGGSITCVYTNYQQLGAIKITKLSSKVSTLALANAHFEVCTNAGPYNTGTNHDVNPCVPAQTGSGNVTTGTDGTKCLDNLAFGTYYVTETQAPTGYGIDNTTANPSSQTAVVGTNASCTSTSGQLALTFTDTPLTKLVVTATGEAAVGTTKSTISCVDSGGNTVGTDVSTPVDPASETILHLPPDTYTCTVLVDP